MKELLEVIVKELVENKNKVFIEEKMKNNTIVLEVRVAEGDMGKIIGKQGKMAKTIRTIMKAVASKEHKKVNIEFIG